nr:S24 family peptidase [uncultured Desulfuromonas sp.]
MKDNKNVSITTLGSRIKELRGPDAREKFAQRLGVSRNTIANYETGHRMPDAPFLNRILELYPEVNPTWLLTGEGTRDKQNGIKTAAASATHINDHDQDRHGKEEYVFLSMQEIDGMASREVTGNTTQVDNCLAFKRSWIKRQGLNPEQLSLVSVRGDSMEPTIKEGAMLLVEKNTAPPGEGIYVFKGEHGLLVRRTQYNPFDHTLSLFCDNPLYPPFTARSEQINNLKMLGRVVWIGGKT